MPIDKYFTSSYKSKGVQSRKILAAKCKRSWPVEGQYKASEETMQLWMRGEGGRWFHVRDLAPQESREEARAWRENNPGWEFRLKEKEKREGPPALKEPGHGYGPPKKKWD